MYKSTHEALLCWLKHVQNKQCQVLPSLGKSAQPRWPAETLCEPLLERSESGKLQKAATVLWLLRLLCKRLTQTAAPSTWVWLRGHPKALWSGSVWLGFSMPLWQQIMLRWTLSVLGEKGKSDLAVGGKHTGSCPQAGHKACHLVVQITSGCQVGQVPFSPQLHLTPGDMLPAPSLRLSFLLIPLSLLVQIPKSLPVW